MDLLSILENGNACVTIQINAKELKDFATHLIEETVELLSTRSSAGQDEYLSKAEVMKLFGVCPTTLWLWDKNNYLKPVRAGRKVMYRKADILRVANGKEDRL